MEDQKEKKKLQLHLKIEHKIMQKKQDGSLFLFPHPFPSPLSLPTSLFLPSFLVSLIKHPEESKPKLSVPYFDEQNQILLAEKGHFH